MVTYAKKGAITHKRVDCSPHEGVWPMRQMGTEIQPVFPLPGCVPWGCAVPSQQQVHLFSNLHKGIAKVTCAQEIITSRSGPLHQTLRSSLCSVG